MAALSRGSGGGIGDAVASWIANLVPTARPFRPPRFPLFFQRFFRTLRPKTIGRWSERGRGCADYAQAAGRRFDDSTPLALFFRIDTERGFIVEYHGFDCDCRGLVG
jgi:hypothetical protein